MADKSTETNPGPLSEALVDICIVNHKINQEEEGEGSEKDDGEVFEYSAQKFLDQDSGKRAAEAAAAASLQGGGMVVDETKAQNSA